MLTEDLEATGPLSAVIYASSSARDTNLTTRLCDVVPDGRSISLSDGVIRARFRDPGLEPQLMEPGVVYPFRIEMAPTSNVLLAGHRIRLQISSSNLPRIDRNLNTGAGYDDAEIVVARQTLYHDAEHASHILLPVIPQRVEGRHIAEAQVGNVRPTAVRHRAL